MPRILILHLLAMASTQTVQAPRLVDAVTAYFARTANIAHVAKTYYRDPGRKKIVKHACFQAGLQDAQEDVHQEVCIRLVPMLLDRMITEQRLLTTVYGVLSKTAFNICRDIHSYRSVRKERSIEEMAACLSEDSDNGDSANLTELIDPYASSMAQRIEAGIDQAKAVAKFEALMLKNADKYSGIINIDSADLEFGNGQNTGSDPALGGIRKVRARKDSEGSRNRHNSKGTKDGEERLALRNLLVKSNSEYANMLGLTVLKIA